MNKEQYKALADKCYDDYEKFLRHIQIPYCGFEPRQFYDVAEQWQIDEAKVLGSTVKNIWCPNSYPYRNVWITRPRGHDKTSSIARVVLWTILFPRPSPKQRVPIDVRVVAVDSEQAQILIDIINVLIQINNMSDLISINKQELYGPGGKATIVAADASSAYGKIIHLLIFDELTHWDTPKSQKLFNALWSGRSKVKNSCTIILTNSGYVGTWQHKLLQNIKKSNQWYVYDKPGRLASWHSEQDLLEIAAGLPPSEVDRLLYNKWVENESTNLHSYLMDNIQETRLTEPMYIVIGIDYASRRDLTAISILEISDKIWVRNVLAGRWAHEELCNIIRDLYRNNNSIAPTYIAADAYQMEHITSMLSKEGINITLIRPTATTNKRMVSLLLRCCESKILMFQSPCLGEYAGETLETEARYCQIGSSPPKITAPTGVHDDRLHSICYALLHAYNKNLLFKCNITVSNIQSNQIANHNPGKPISYMDVRSLKISDNSIFGIRPQKIMQVNINNRVLNTSKNNNNQNSIFS